MIDGHFSDRNKVDAREQRPAGIGRRSGRKTAEGLDAFQLLTYKAMPAACLTKHLFAGEHYIEVLFGVNRVRANFGEIGGARWPRI